MSKKDFLAPLHLVTGDLKASELDAALNRIGNEISDLNKPNLHNCLYRVFESEKARIDRRKRQLLMESHETAKAAYTAAAIFMKSSGALNSKLPVGELPERID